MVGFAGLFAQFAFGFLLVVSLIPAWLVCMFAKLVRLCLSPERHSALEKSVSGVLIVMMVLLWRLLFFLCAWIRLDVEYSDGSFLGMLGKPAVLVMNHTSFLDAMLAVSLAPLPRSLDVRVLVANYVFDIPLLSTVMREIGLAEVPFKGAAGEHSNMAVDKNLMDERLKSFNDHVTCGGVGAWFPEGLRNRGDPTVLQEFRAGAFSVPVRTDVEIWCCAAVGCNVSWPVKATVGGLPADIRVKVFRLAASSHALLTDVEGDERAKAIHLASLAKAAVQEGINELVAKDSGKSTQEKQS